MFSLKQRILIMASNPLTMDRLHLGRQVRDIKEGLSLALQRDRFTIEECWAVRIRDFRRALLNMEPHIVHFCGHGAGPGATRGWLILEDDEGKSQLMNGPALSGLFELFADKTSCVILNAGHTQTQALAIAQHIDYVISMRDNLDLDLAREFAVGFYDALGAGRPIEEAFRFGCNAILSFIKPNGPAIPSHMIPVLTRKRGDSPKKQKAASPGKLSPEERHTLMSDYKAMLARNDANDEAHFGLAHCFLQIKNYDYAIKHFQRSIELNPENSDAHYYAALASIRGTPPRSLTHQCIKNIEQALNTAINLNPSQATYHYLRYILQMDYYAFNGLRSPPPSPEQSLRQAHSGQHDPWAVECLLQSITLRDQRIVNSIRQQR